MGVYEESLQQAIDIIEHLPTLKALAAQAPTVLELGIREGHSSAALLAGNPLGVTSVDIATHPRHQAIMAEYPGWKLHIVDSLKFDSSQGYDMMFIDTVHQYAQCLKELELHAPNIKRYIALHDTVSFARHDEFTNAKGGVLSAVEDFLLTEGTDWEIYKHYENNNGLMILKRRI